MPRYDAKPLEAKWQAYWDQQQTFKTGASEPAKSKLYVLDMFPYPSGAGLHVGHPEGYTATDIVCRYNRMKGRQVLHPMGWDAFGLPAEEYAIKTGTHPAITTAKNIETFKRQLKMLGFSYDWTRELATTDPDYFRWTQWIFLQLFDTWYDPDFAWTGPDGKKRIGRGRPISELPIPPDVAAQGEVAVRRYQDKQRLAYQHDAPVNWCPALGTVLANEEVIDGKSEVGGHPVERLPLRQWMLRITAYADRLATELDNLNWPESIKLLQRNWIGRSEGAEVDFWIGMSGSPLPPGEGLGVRDTIAKDRSSATTLTRAPASLTPALSQGEREFDAWKSSRAQTGFPHEPGDDVLRIYTTRPDTLFGATYMVLAPEHPAVDRLTTPEQRAAVDEYRKQAATKSDLDRTDLAKTKSGVFTGGYAINPVNREKIPVWIADYVLISYGTGAIMAVPAHDERDFMFAKQFGLPIRAVVQPPDKWIQWVAMSYAISLVERQENESAADLGYSASQIEQIHRGYVQLGGLPGKDVYPDSIEPAREDYLKRCGNWPVVFTELGAAVNSGPYTGIPTDEFKSKITVDLVAKGLGRKAVNYRLRDWLFSRQRYWGEPFPIWHELDANGQTTGLLRVDADSDLPITLPEMADFKPTGTPEPMLSKAPGSWLFKTAPDGKKLKRETNTMPQWAGSCWYYLRFVDNKNSQRFIDPELEKQWLPIDLYVGGAEHAVLHLLYSRFWHKVLFDRGYVHTAEPFQRLVNQGMILGEVEYTGFKLDEVQDGKTDDLAKLNAQVEELGLDVTKLENRLATLQADPVANPHEVTALQAQIAADKAKIAATLANEDTLRWVSAKQVNEAIDDEGQTIRIDLKTGQPVKPVKLSVDQIEKKGDGFLLKANPDIAVESRAYKMSKSRGNVINPDIVVDDYGADSLRLYEMFMGPLEAVKPWSMQGVEGVFRFLSRVWRTVTDEKAADVRLNSAVQDIEPTTEQRRLLHKTIRAVTNDLESLGFNTAISRMMEFINEVSGWDVRPVSIMKPFVLLLSPFAPHIAEELWSALGGLGGTKTLAFEPWPTFDPQLVEDAEIEVPVQINGKLRGKVKVAAQADQSAVETAAKSDTLVAGQLAGKTIVKVVYVPGRMVNFVVK